MRLSMRCSLLLLAALCSICLVAAQSAPYLTITNPLLQGDMADPDVVRIDEGGEVFYLLTHTVGSGPDIPFYTSTDLVHWKLTAHAFGKTAPGGASLQLGDYFYCNVWAPEVRPSPVSGGYLLSFTASRFSSHQAPCPAYDEGSGVFVSWAEKPMGPYDSPHSHPHPTGRNVEWCPDVPEMAQPFSWEVDHHDCSPGLCNNTMRLDSDLFNDPRTGESWFSYAWYSNSEVITRFDHSQLGEHVSMVKVNASAPEWVSCDTQEATKVWAVSPHDSVTLQALNNSCPRCSEQLSFSKGRLNETMMRDGVVWGVAEAPMVFRRGDWVYLLASHSAWDSAYYSVMWIASQTVEGLDLSNGAGGERLVGRFLIPSLQQSFGHGTAVLGPDGSSWYYIHHHLDHSTCTSPASSCPRNIYLSPLNFEDRGDGRGEVWIREVFPAEELKVKVYQAAGTEGTERGSEEEGEEAMALA